MAANDLDIYVTYEKEEFVPKGAKVIKCKKPNCKGCEHFWHPGIDEYNNYPAYTEKTGVIWVRLKSTPEREKTLTNFHAWWKQEIINLKAENKWKIDPCPYEFHKKFVKQQMNRCQYYHPHLDDQVIVEDDDLEELEELEEWCGIVPDTEDTPEHRWDRVDKLQRIVKAIAEIGI